MAALILRKRMILWNKPTNVGLPSLNCQSTTCTTFTIPWWKEFRLPFVRFGYGFVTIWNKRKRLLQWTQDQWPAETSLWFAKLPFLTYSPQQFAKTSNFHVEGWVWRSSDARVYWVEAQNVFHSLRGQTKTLSQRSYPISSKETEAWTVPSGSAHRSIIRNAKHPLWLSEQGTADNQDRKGITVASMTRGTVKRTVSRAYHWNFMKLETRLFWTMTIGENIQRLAVPRGVNFSHWGG